MKNKNFNLKPNTLKQIPIWLTDDYLIQLPANEFLNKQSKLKALLKKKLKKNNCVHKIQQKKK